MTRFDRQRCDPPAGQGVIAVAVAHGDPYVAAGISALLRSGTDFNVRSGPPDGQAVDVIVTDHGGGIAAMSSWQRRVDPPPVLVVTDQETGWQIRRALGAGVHGYLLQDCSRHELLSAVRCVAGGGKYVGGLVAERLLDSLGHVAPTGRELQVLQLMARGLRNREIGAALGIGEGTVKSHVKALLGKLDAATRTAAIGEAQRRGLVAAEAPCR